MTKQRSVLEELTRNPVRETKTWLVGEPLLQDVLGDPVVHAVLRRDGLTTQDLMRAIIRARSCLAARRRSSDTLIPMGSGAPPPPAAQRTIDAA